MCFFVAAQKCSVWREEITIKILMCAYKFLYRSVQLVKYDRAFVWDDESVVSAGQASFVPVVGVIKIRIS